MTRVLVLSTSRKTRGGITAVLKAFEQTPLWNKYHCHWVQTHRDGPNWRKILYLILAWLDFLVRIPFYDILHVHFSLQTTARRKKPFVRLAKFLGKKVIIHLHCGSQIDAIWNHDYEYLFRTADVSLFLSDNLKRKVEKYTGTGNDYRVCYNPCPVVYSEPKYTKKQQILFSGTLYEGKGYRDLIRAFAIIAPKYKDWKLVFAGNGEIDEGKKIASECGVSNQVKFLGWVSGLQKDRVFKESSLLCLPSYAEGFPMAVLDAWSYGLPVVTTPVGGIPDVAIDGVNMLLFDPGDIDVLSKNLDMLINDNVLRNRLEVESSRMASTTFNLNVIVEQLESIYEELTQTTTQELRR